MFTTSNTKKVKYHHGLASHISQLKLNLDPKYTQLPFGRYFFRLPLPSTQVYISSGRDPSLLMQAGAWDTASVILANTTAPNLIGAKWILLPDGRIQFTDTSQGDTYYMFAEGQDGAQVIVAKSANCPATEQRCLWNILPNGTIQLRAGNGAFLMNAYGGAGQFTNVKVVGNCSADNPDCKWNLVNLNPWGYLWTDGTNANLNTSLNSVSCTTSCPPYPIWHYIDNLLYIMQGGTPYYLTKPTGANKSIGFTANITNAGTWIIYVDPSNPTSPIGSLVGIYETSSNMSLTGINANADIKNINNIESMQGYAPHTWYYTEASIEESVIYNPPLLVGPITLAQGQYCPTGDQVEFTVTLDNEYQFINQIGLWNNSGKIGHISGYNVYNLVNPSDPATNGWRSIDCDHTGNCSGQGQVVLGPGGTYGLVAVNYNTPCSGDFRSMDSVIFYWKSLINPFEPIQATYWNTNCKDCIYQNLVSKHDTFLDTKSVYPPISFSEWDPINNGNRDWFIHSITFRGENSGNGGWQGFDTGVTYKYLYVTNPSLRFFPTNETQLIPVKIVLVDSPYELDESKGAKIDYNYTWQTTTDNNVINTNIDPSTFAWECLYLIQAVGSGDSSSTFKIISMIDVGKNSGVNRCISCNTSDKLVMTGDCTKAEWRFTNFPLGNNLKGYPVGCITNINGKVAMPSTTGSNIKLDYLTQYVENVPGNPALWTLIPITGSSAESIFPNSLDACCNKNWSNITAKASICTDALAWRADDTAGATDSPSRQCALMLSDYCQVNAPSPVSTVCRDIDYCSLPNPAKIDDHCRCYLDDSLLKAYQTKEMLDSYSTTIYSDKAANGYCDPQMQQSDRDQIKELACFIQDKQKFSSTFGTQCFVDSCASTDTDYPKFHNCPTQLVICNQTQIAINNGNWINNVTNMAQAQSCGNSTSPYDQCNVLNTSLSCSDQGVPTYTLNVTPQTSDGMYDTVCRGTVKSVLAKDPYNITVNDIICQSGSTGCQTGSIITPDPNLVHVPNTNQYTFNNGQQSSSCSSCQLTWDTNETCQNHEDVVDKTVFYRTVSGVSRGCTDEDLDVGDRQVCCVIKKGDLYHDSCDLDKTSNIYLRKQEQIIYDTLKFITIRTKNKNKQWVCWNYNNEKTNYTVKLSICQDPATSYAQQTFIYDSDEKTLQTYVSNAFLDGFMGTWTKSPNWNIFPGSSIIGYKYFFITYNGQYAYYDIDKDQLIFSPSMKTLWLIKEYNSRVDYSQKCPNAVSLDIIPPCLSSNPPTCSDQGSQVTNVDKLLVGVRTTDCQPCSYPDDKNIKCQWDSTDKKWTKTLPVKPSRNDPNPCPTGPTKTVDCTDNEDCQLGTPINDVCSDSSKTRTETINITAPSNQQGASCLQMLYNMDADWKKLNMSDIKGSVNTDNTILTASGKCSNCTLTWQNEGVCTLDPKTNTYKQKQVSKIQDPAFNKGTCNFDPNNPATQEVPCSAVDCQLGTISTSSCDKNSGFQHNTIPIISPPISPGKSCDTMLLDAYPLAKNIKDSDKQLDFDLSCNVNCELGSEISSTCDTDKGISLNKYNINILPLNQGVSCSNIAQSTYPSATNISTDLVNKIVSFNLPCDVPCVLGNKISDNCSQEGTETIKYSITTLPKNQGKTCESLAKEKYPNETSITINDNEVTILQKCQPPSKSNTAVIVGIVAFFIILAIIIKIRRKK